MKSIGVGINYLELGLLDNNTIITADTDETISDLHCSSGSKTPNVGHWIAPNGNDLTHSAVDPFDVLQGDESDPGSLIIRQASGHIITNSFQGVYTCILPDENGLQNYLHVGIYQNEFSCKLKLLNQIFELNITKFPTSISFSDYYISGCNS